MNPTPTQADLDALRKLLEDYTTTDLLQDGRAHVTHMGGPFSFHGREQGHGPSACLTCGGTVSSYIWDRPSTWRHAPDCAAWKQEVAYSLARTQLQRDIPTLVQALLQTQARLRTVPQAPRRIQTLLELTRSAEAMTAAVHLVSDVRTAVIRMVTRWHSDNPRALGGSLRYGTPRDAANGWMMDAQPPWLQDEVSLLGLGVNLAILGDVDIADQALATLRREVSDPPFEGRASRAYRVGDHTGFDALMLVYPTCWPGIWLVETITPRHGNRQAWVLDAVDPDDLARLWTRPPARSLEEATAIHAAGFVPIPLETFPADALSLGNIHEAAAHLPRSPHP